MFNKSTDQGGLASFCYYFFGFIGVVAIAISMFTSVATAGYVPTAAALPCAAGNYVDGVGVCTECPAGTFNDVADANECVACADGEYALAGSTECTPCPENCANTEGVCEKDNGACIDNGVDAKCAAGYWGATCNNECECGSEPIACHPDGRCAVCTLDYGLSDGVCTKCPAGQYGGLEPCHTPSMPV